jgi:trimeric autotransporter adhesin
MDPRHTRLDALEQQMHAVNRRLRWWRGLACGLIGLAGLTWALPSVTAQQAPKKKSSVTARQAPKKTSLDQRVAALEHLLRHFTRQGNEVVITGANLHIVNGLGSTDCSDEQRHPMPDCPNGLGNLIVGYNEPRVNAGLENIRTGSHNVVVGQEHNFSRVGGLVVGRFNTISGDFAVVSGGTENTASGFDASVSGGFRNTASEGAASVSGGSFNAASGGSAAVSGGAFNSASGVVAAVSGGRNNRASEEAASVSGGSGNTASGFASSVSGGGRHPFSGEGAGNTASGVASSVSGGLNRTAAGAFDWGAGRLVEDE